MILCWGLPGNRLSVVVAKQLPGIASSGGVSFDGGALDGTQQVESLGVVDNLNEEIQNLFLNDKLRGNVGIQ